MRDRKSPHVSRTLVNILAHLNKAVVWMVSDRPPISNSFYSLTKSLRTVPVTLIALSITVTFMFPSFYNFLVMTRSCLLAGIRLSVCVSKSQRNLCITFSRTDSGWWIYHLVVWSNLNLLHDSQWITFKTHSCLVS